MKTLLVTLNLLLIGPVFSFGVTQVKIQLDWIYNAQFSGLYQAIEQGYFAEHDIEVELIKAPKSIGVIDAVVEDDAIIFGTSESSVLLVERLKGQPVVALAPMFQTTPMGWMSLSESDIDSVEDFKGKRIGIHGDGEKILEVALARAGLSLDDITFVEVGYNPSILIAGEIDLMQAYVIDEYIELQRLTKGTGKILLAGENGYLAYSQVLFTSESVIANHREIVFQIMEACRKGWAYALDNQEETVDLILKKWTPDLNREYQLGSLAKIEGLVRPSGGEIMPWVSTKKWQAMQDLLLQFDLLSHAVPLDELIFQP